MSLTCIIFLEQVLSYRRHSVTCQINYIFVLKKVFHGQRCFSTGSIQCGCCHSVRKGSNLRQVAFLIGRPQCSRMVGHVMHDVPSELHLPCHRVVNSQGRLVPFWVEQRALLESEGVQFRKSGMVDMKVSQWKFIEE